MRGQVDKEGGVGMDDAAGFFANVFGGERFNDYVRRARQSYLAVADMRRSARSRS